MEKNNDDILNSTFEIMNKLQQYKSKYGEDKLETLLKQITSFFEHEKNNIKIDTEPNRIAEEKKDIESIENTKDENVEKNDFDLSAYNQNVGDVSIYAQEPDVLKKVREDIINHGDNNIIKEEEKPVTRVLEANYTKIPNPYE